MNHVNEIWIDLDVDMHTNIQYITFKKFSNVEAELKKCVAYKKKIFLRWIRFLGSLLKVVATLWNVCSFLCLKQKSYIFFISCFPFHLCLSTPRTLFKTCSKKYSNTGNKDFVLVTKMHLFVNSWNSLLH